MATHPMPLDADTVIICGNHNAAALVETLNMACVSLALAHARKAVWLVHEFEHVSDLLQFSLQFGNPVHRWHCNSISSTAPATSASRRWRRIGTATVLRLRPAASMLAPFAESVLCHCYVCEAPNM